MTQRSAALPSFKTFARPESAPALYTGPLRRALRKAQEEARLRGGPVVASLVVPFPEVDSQRLAALLDLIDDDAFFWRPPGAESTLLGAGCAHAVTASGPERFAAVKEAWEALSRGARIERAGSEGAPPPMTGPLLLGGFAFDPLAAKDPLWTGFPDALFLLPRLMVTQGASGSWLTLNAAVEADSDPEVEAERLLAAAGRLEAAREAAAGEAGVPEGEQPGGVVRLDEGDTARWKAAVAEAAAAVRSGRLQKAVLARRARARLPGPARPGRTLAALIDAYPECYGFAVRRGGRTFLGATPERLVAVEGRDVCTMCLAGSIRRGESPEEDQRLGEQLLSDPKNLEEHRIVVAMIRSALEAFCESLEVAPAPSLLKVRNVQHLFTPVRGRLAAPRSILDLVERLHPTPAVGGHPTGAALELIRAVEGMDRGWYAGPVGWIGPGGGDFAVALRSALLAGDEAHLFAGCGIVADSDPDAEFEESALKMRPVIQALERSPR